ncbi:alpha/beta fold hydrolase [Catellatospora tritici]|uniref:alpha/beta fold hydrolase n=1 Tax=Catellatospora tritici TaxID=2851566 RepID=UPI001C2D2B0F|nr:alpha/beta hydrolase [Catellatospora tritici]MBV1856227.1 alpha/beta hydrolase [Catellatospora tritici]
MRTAHLSWRRFGAQPDTVEPSVVLLHGFTDSADCWEPVAAGLTAKTPAIAVDARGHGASGLPDEPTGPHRHAADVALVLDALGLSGLTVIGHSMGAVTAAALAGDRPDLVRTLVLEDPPAIWEPAVIAEPPQWIVELKALDHAGRMARGRAENPAWPSTEFDTWSRSKAEFDIRFCGLPFERGVALPDLLARTWCPALLLHGDPARGALLTGEDVAACVAATDGRVTARYLDAGHCLRRDDPAAFLAAVGEFLG